jgi:hypothetical protein
MVLEAQFQKSYETPTILARLGAFFGGLAALLVACRTIRDARLSCGLPRDEIGVRIAMGATRLSAVMVLCVRGYGPLGHLAEEPQA